MPTAANWKKPRIEKMKKARKGNPEKFTGNRELKNGLSVESKGSSVSKVCGQMTSKNQHRQKWSKQEGKK